MATPVSNLKRLSVRGGSKSAHRKAPSFEFDRIWLDKTVAEHPQTFRILNKLKDIEVDIIDDLNSVKNRRSLDSAKKQLLLTAHNGTSFKSCQGIGAGWHCCGLKTLNLVSGCPMDCSYCILQSYLANNPVTTIYVNIETILAEVSAFLSAHQNKFFRVCTGELSDSLALDTITEYAPILIPFFASKRNAMLELKTKTANVDHLLGLKHKNRTVISWSVNTPQIIETEERGTATLDERLAAAQKVASAGFGVGFHFDPIIATYAEKDIEGYLDVIEKIFSAIEPRQISWVSLGLLRYPSDLPGIALKRFKDTKIFTGEFVPSGNKMRYLRFIREAVYKPLWDKLSSKLPAHKIYLCMETPAVWEKIDPSITSGACIEKRLCNTEAVPFDFRM